MLFQIKTINGQKTIVPLTADTGAGNPVGTVIVVCSNQIPSNYLPLGTQYDTSLYPVLYALLGTDTTPTASALGLPTLSSGQYAIKATSGLTENQQENVLNTINENNSYSTEEHPTGAKWIDGKPIYRKVVDFGTLPNTNSKRVNHNISNMDTVLKYNIIADDGTYYIGVPRTGINATDKTDVFFTRTYVEITTWSDLTQYVKTYVIIEYTKTTD